MTYAKLAVCWITAFFLLSISAAAGQERVAIRVVGYPPDNGSKLPLYLAHRAGMFEKNGLQVSIINPGSNENAFLAMKNNQAEIYVVSATQLVSNIMKGAGDFRIVANTGYNYFKFLADLSITRPEDLKGKRIGTGTPGSTPDRITRLILRKLGLDPEKDVVLVPSQGEGRSQVSLNLAKLVSGELAASSMTSEGIYQLEQSGLDKKLRVLTDYKSLNIYTGGGADYTVSAAFLKTSRATVKAFLKTLCEAVALGRSDKAIALETLRAMQRSTDPALLEFTRRIYVDEVIPQRPFPKIESAELAIQMSGVKSGIALKADDLVDRSLLQELETEGLFQRLYR